MSIWVEITARVHCDGVTVEDGDRLAFVKRAWVLSEADVPAAVEALPGLVPGECPLRSRPEDGAP